MISGTDIQKHLKLIQAVYVESLEAKSFSHYNFYIKMGSGNPLFYLVLSMFDTSDENDPFDFIFETNEDLSVLLTKGLARAVKMRETSKRSKESTIS